MKLIGNWRDGWRFTSIRAMTAATALQGAWLALPDDLRATLPPWLPQTIAMVLLALGVFARLVRQDKLHRTSGHDYTD